MEHYELVDILHSIWEDKEYKYLYNAAQKIADQSRYPQMYNQFKQSWEGEVKKEFTHALKILKEYGWKEPATKM